MSDTSTGSELLELARRTLRQQLLKHIPAEKKYTALMVAGAMAIVARQIEQGDNTPNEAQARQLCKNIRAGKVGPDSGDYDTVYKQLSDQARQNVLISNPGYLDK